MVKRILVILMILNVACSEEVQDDFDFTSLQLTKLPVSNNEIVTGRISNEPFVVQVVDKNGNPVPDVPIAWDFYYDNQIEPYAAVSVFDPELSSDQSTILADLTSDKDGFAQCFIRMPYGYDSADPDILVELTAKITRPERELEAQEPVRFSLRSLDQTHTYDAIKVNGDNQTGKILIKSNLPIKLRLQDEAGFGVYNYKVEFTSESTDWSILSDPEEHDGSISGDPMLGYEAITDGNGNLSVYWTYGKEAGPQKLIANVYTSSGKHMDGSPLVFSADVADIELTISLVSGGAQTAAAATGLAVPLAVMLEDENSNLVEGYEVIWEVPQGHKIQHSHFLDEPVNIVNSTQFSSRSNADGIARVRLVTDNVNGSYTAQGHVYDAFGGEVNGSPVTFNYSTYAKGSFTDPRDNKVYETIDFNGATWFTQNLNYQEGNGICYDDVAAYCDEFGTLYSWNEANNAAPPGWHIPSDQEWKELELYLGMDPDVVNDYGSARERVFDLGLMDGEWSGMNILGGGYYNPSSGFFAGKYAPLNQYGYADGQWTANEYNAERAIWRVMGTDLYSTVGRFADSKEFKAYIRCVKD